MRASEERAGYELEIAEGGGGEVSLAERLETALVANPHYAWARKLGQLEPVRVVVVNEDAARERLRSHGGRIGDVKPVVLVGRKRGER